jgi:aminoglycoside phosphotransferase (APT) family kinase protein
VSEWEPEIEVDERLARRLITEQFPDFDAGSLEPIGEGWDYTIWATADRVAFRFPRRVSVLAGMQREMNVLPWLAQRLPIAVPDARYQGAPGEQFSWPFFGSKLISGQELTHAEIPANERVGLARDLGAFLRTLHTLSPPCELLSVIDPNGRADMSLRVPRTRDMIGRISTHWPAAQNAEPILAAAERLPPEPRTVLSHGDLHLRQILVTDTARLSGVVDWVDVCLAPASLDLSLLWSLFDAQGRESFLAVYGPVDASTLLKARVLAMCLSAMLAAYALDQGNARLLRETLEELDRALVD